MKVEDSRKCQVKKKLRRNGTAEKLKKKTQEKRVDNQREGKYQDLSQEKGDGM